MTNNYMRCLCLCLLSAISLGLHAQHQRPSTRALLFGLGRSSQYDTYLSPSAYKGPALTILSETRRQLLRNEHVVYQSRIEGMVTNTENHAETANQMAGDLTYASAWLRQWSPLWQGLTLMAGGQIRAHAGFLYNTRNGNNPAQGYADMQSALTVIGHQRFHIRRQSLAVYYQAALPIVGGMFTPRYGQSYYNIFSQGHYDHNIVCTHPGNALSLHQTLTFDIPVRHATVRVAYQSDLRQAQVAGLRQHHYTRAGLIGYVRNINLWRN